MTTATFVRLIFLKDVRRTRLPLLVMLGLTVLLVLSAQPGRMDNPVPAALLLQLLCLGLIFQLIQNDPAGRDFRFLFTRPVPASAILIAKALFFTVFMVVPSCVIHELIVARLGVPLLPLDHLLMFLETAILTAYEISLFVLLNIFFRGLNPRDGAIAALLFGIAFSINAFILTPQRNALQAWGNETQLWLIGFSDLLFELLVVAVVVVAATIRYQTKRYWLPLGVAIGGMTLSLVLWLLLTSIPSPNLYFNFKVKEPLTAGQWSHLHVTPPVLTRTAQGGNLYDSSFNYKTFQGAFTVEGLPATYFAFPTRCQTVATLRSGKRVVFDTAILYHALDAGGSPIRVNMRATLRGTGIPQSQMAAVAGLLPNPMDNAQQLAFSPFSYEAGSLQGEDLTGARLQGTITVTICRAYLAGSLPLKSGQTLLAPRHRYTITDTYFSRDDVQFSLDSLQVPLSLRGESTHVSSSDMQDNFLVVYRPFNEALDEGSGGSDGSLSNDVVKEMLFHATCNTAAVEHGPNWRPLPPDWASGAELVFVGSEPCGQVTLPYEIDNVDLH